jgi:hypothetical protein
MKKLANSKQQTASSSSSSSNNRLRHFKKKRISVVVFVVFNADMVMTYSTHYLRKESDDSQEPPKTAKILFLFHTTISLLRRAKNNSVSS